MHSTVHSSPIHSITQNVESLQNPETTVVATCPPVVIGVGDGGIMGARAPPPLKYGEIFFGQLLCKIQPFFCQKLCKIRKFC